MSKDSRSYDIHFNGGVPFIVEDFFKDNFAVIHVQYVDDKVEWDDFPGGKDNYTPLCQIEYLNFFPGKDYNEKSKVVGKYADGDGKQHGNNCIIQVDETKFLHVGQTIRLFKLTKSEVIEDFVSFIGHSDVPYAYLITNKNYWFFDDNHVYARKTFDSYECEESTVFGKNYECGKQIKSKIVKPKMIFDSDSKKIKFPTKATKDSIRAEFYPENFTPKFWTLQHKWGN